MCRSKLLPPRTQPLPLSQIPLGHSFSTEVSPLPSILLLKIPCSLGHPKHSAIYLLNDYEYINYLGITKRICVKNYGAYYFLILTVYVLLFLDNIKAVITNRIKKIFLATLLMIYCLKTPLAAASNKTSMLTISSRNKYI